MERSRRLIIRLGKYHPAFDWLVELRAGISSLGSVTLAPVTLAPVPGG